MVSLRRCQFLVTLAVVLVCVPALCQEPNEAKTELKFEMDSKEVPWEIYEGAGRESGKGPIKPNYRVEFYSTTYTTSNEKILQTGTGQSMSKLQREFLKITNGSLSAIRARGFREHYHVRLYAVSEDDARKMTEAFIEILSERAQAKRHWIEKDRRELQEKVAEIKKKLPEKQKELERAESKYKEVKSARYFSFHDDEACKKAKESRLQMQKVLDLLEIELAGIREKLGAIEDYREPKSLTDTLRYRSLPEPIIAKLDQMVVEQMIELRGAEARKETAIRIREREEKFCNLFDQWDSLVNEVNSLKSNLSSSERSLIAVEKSLANPPLNMLPPKVYQNKVTIYPVSEQQ